MLTVLLKRPGRANSQATSTPTLGTQGLQLHSCKSLHVPNSSLCLGREGTAWEGESLPAESPAYTTNKQTKTKDILVLLSLLTPDTHACCKTINLFPLLQSISPTVLFSSQKIFHLWKSVRFFFPCNSSCSQSWTETKTTALIVLLCFWCLRNYALLQKQLQFKGTCKDLCRAHINWPSVKVVII